MKQKIRIIILVLILIFSYNFFSSKNFLYSEPNNFFLIDTSYSMGTLENGSSRFQKAKDFVKNFEGKKIGVFSFGENIVYNFPLSENKNILKPILDNIKLGNISAGENIIDAISGTLEKIKNINGEKKLFVLSDGGKKNIDFQSLEKNLIENKIKLFIIGIGQNQASNLTLLDSSGQSRQVKDKGQIVSTSQNETLKNINKIKNGKYYDIKNYKNNFFDYDIILIFLIILYLGTYLKLK